MKTKQSPYFYCNLSHVPLTLILLFHLSFTPNSYSQDTNQSELLYWALATRPAGIGYATAVGNSVNDALDNAIHACNEAEHNSTNLGGSYKCMGAGSSNMAKEYCIAIVNGYVAATSYTAHIGRGYEERDPRAAALGEAFRYCREHWGTYGKTACRNYNGAGGNGIKTSFVFCTSDAVELYAPHLPKPKIVSRFHNDDGSIIKESDYTDQSPLAKEIRRIRANSSLSAPERMKRIQAARKRYR